MRGGVRLRLAAAVAGDWAAANISEPDRERFAEIAESELMNLHEGNFARFRLRPSEFDDWQRLQDDDDPGGRRGAVRPV